VAVNRIHLPDYAFLEGHEFSASLYKSQPEASWTGEVFDGIKVTCWFQRRHQNGEQFTS